MDRERWKRAKADPALRHHPLRDAVFGAVGAALVGVPVAFTTGSAIAVAISAPATGIVAYALSVTWERIWNYAREPVVRLEARVKELEGYQPAATLAEAPPALVLTQRGSGGILQEMTGPAGVLVGYIHLQLQFQVAARDENPSPVTIMRMTAKIVFEGKSPIEAKTESFEWYDATIRNEVKPDSGPIIVSPGRVLFVSCSFTMFAEKAQEGVDDFNRKFHLPGSTKLTEVTAIDSLNRRYPLEEEIEFRVQRV